jgi:hypothetical protein
LDDTDTASLIAGLFATLESAERIARDPDRRAEVRALCTESLGLVTLLRNKGGLDRRQDAQLHDLMASFRMVATDASSG